MVSGGCPENSARERRRLETGSDPTTWPGCQSRVVAFYFAANIRAESAGQPIEDQSSAATVTAISAVPAFRQDLLLSSFFMAQCSRRPTTILVQAGRR
jgi:hypothetical protein